MPETVAQTIEEWQNIATTLEMGFQCEHGRPGATARESARVRRESASELTFLYRRGAEIADEMERAANVWAQTFPGGERCLVSRELDAFRADLLSWLGSLKEEGGPA